ncbi:helix-turn-helix transcriptional regulator [Natronorubrum sp. DTA28]|uniref:helix-turn-helix transcriptional regulator n=1 Tax=Natronorubrum sp. DTA28 TaxID=3447019 RepID=UPI003F832F80
MTSDEYEDALTILRQAPVLEACQTAPQSRRELVDATDTSKTTIYRATRALEAEGLLEKTADGYRTTPRGGATGVLAKRYLAGLDALEGLDRLFDLVDHPELAEHAHLLADARVTVADASDPYRVVDRVVERFEATTRSRGTITNATSLQVLDRVSPSLNEKESIERIFDASALEAHENYGGEAFEEALASDSATLLVTDDPLPFTFAIDDEGVGIVGHEPATGLPTVHVESDDERARTWLKRLYEESRRHARTID